MLILSLDTTTRAGSAAIVRDGQIVQEVAGNPALSHGERLPTDLMRLLESAHASVEDIDLFAVAAGPGSFTGLRVGIATIQGLAMARERKVVPVSVLEALAHGEVRAGRVAAAWMDAQRGQVFGALYGPNNQVLAEASSLPPAETLASWEGLGNLSGATFIGDGAVRYAEVLRSHLGSRIVVAPPPPLAGIIGQIAADQPSRAVQPHAVVPIYVRRSDAELARTRQLDRTQP
jgi:tRNA threonylcarbamoyladenosine biosynthesis protein TsaB